MSFENKDELELEQASETAADAATEKETESAAEVETEVTAEVETEENDEEPVKAPKAKKNASATRSARLRKLRYGSNAAALTAVVVAAIVLLNVIVGIVADRYPMTLDLSANKVFTLSEESVEIAEKITQELQMVIFQNESDFINPNIGAQNGVPELDTTLKEFYNALQQYRRHSNNNFSYSFIDANQQPSEYAKYEKYNVDSGSILFIYGERYKICTIDDLYTYSAGDDYYSNSYDFSSKVERTLAANVNSLVSGSDRIVQVLVGHKEDTTAINGLKELYELNGYDFEEISITGSASFHEKAEVMLIAAPEIDYSESEIKRVQEWVYNDGNYGRHLMVFTNPTAHCPNLYQFLDVEYNVQVTDEILLETDYNRMYSYNSYFTLTDVLSTNIIKDSVGVGKVITPLARRINSTLSDYDDEVTQQRYRQRITSYPQSAQLVKLADLQSETDDEKIYQPADIEYPLCSMLVSVIDSYNNNTSSNVYGTITVSGCPAMAYSSYLQSKSFDNEAVLLETINSVTGNDTGITISNKDLSAKTISFNGGTAVVLGLGFFTIGLPIIILVICLIVFLRRKNL